MNQEINKPKFGILFVDDEELTRKYFNKGLKNDFIIFTAESVEEAKKILEDKSDEIAVVITDQRMPGGNGVILLKHLKEFYPGIIRILTTAYSDLSEAIESVNKGEIFRYIQKPWDYNLLKTELKQAVDLFAIRLDRDGLLKEKLIVKKKMTRVNRLYLLITIAKNLQNIKSIFNSIDNFVREFSERKILDKSLDDLSSFELGQKESLEIMLFIRISDKINDFIKLSDDFNPSKNIKDLFKDFNISNNLYFIIDNILSTTKSDIESKILDDKSLQISLKNIDENILNENNILNISSDEENIDISAILILLFILIGHNGGNVRINEDLVIIIPSEKNIDDNNELSENMLEDMLVSIMFS